MSVGRQAALEHELQAAVDELEQRGARQVWR